MSPISSVTPQDPHDQLLDAYLEYLRNFDRASALQHEHVRAYVLPAVSHHVAAEGVKSEATAGVEDVKPEDAVEPKVPAEPKGDLVKKEDLQALCDAWASLNNKSNLAIHVSRKAYLDKRVDFARLVGRMACCLNMNLKVPVSYAVSICDDVDAWTWRKRLYKAYHMYTKFTFGRQKKNASSARAFMRMFRECMNFSDECKTDAECLALERQLKRITKAK